MKPPHFFLSVVNQSCRGAFFAVGLALMGFGCGATGGSQPPQAKSPASSGRAAAAGAATGVATGSLSDSALLPAAQSATQTEDWVEAERLYRELARRQPRNPAAKRGIGVALMRQGKNRPAEAALNDSLELADQSGTRLALAENYGQLNRYPSALPHLRRAVAMDAQNAAAWSQLAMTLVKVEKPEVAAEALTESANACKSCRNDDGWRRSSDEVARALTARAETQVSAGDAKGASKSLDLAAALNPDLPETHIGRAKVARTLGDDTRATSEFRKAVDKLPDATAEPGASARLELARLLTFGGEGAEATKLAQQVVDARGENVATLDVLGRACDANHDVKCARKAYGRLMSLPVANAATQSEDAPGATATATATAKTTATTPKTAPTSREAVEHARARLKALKRGGGRKSR